MKASQLLGALLLFALAAVDPAAGQNLPSPYVEPPNLTALVAAAAKEGTLTLGASATFGGNQAQGLGFSVRVWKTCERQVQQAQ